MIVPFMVGAKTHYSIDFNAHSKSPTVGISYYINRKYRMLTTKTRNPVDGQNLIKGGRYALLYRNVRSSQDMTATRLDLLIIRKPDHEKQEVY